VALSDMVPTHSPHQTYTHGEDMYEDTLIELIEDNISVIGRVVSYEPEIGLTIVNSEDSEDYLVCLIGPKSPIALKNEKGDYTEEEAKNFKLITSRIVRCIEMGLPLLYGEITDGVSCGDDPSAEGCPFNQ